jgi:acetyl esterase/lipase
MDGVVGARAAVGLTALVGGAAIVGGAALVTPLVRRQLRMVAAIDPQLRTPVVYAPASVGPRVTRLMRRLPAPQDAAAGAGSAAGGVSVRVVAVPPQRGLDGVEVRTYDPPGRALGSAAVLCLHGGGYVIGSAASDDAFCVSLARRLGVLVVSVEYRLAPEHPFPAAHDDCLRALRWMHSEADRLGIDPARIGVSGESAGGGLAAGLVQHAVDEGTPVCFQHLVYPMLDDRTVGRADRGGEWNAVWTPRSNRFGWASYLGHDPGTARPPPYSVPSRRTELAGLPPTWIGVGAVDLFHAEGAAYAAELRRCGVPCELLVVPGMYHAAQRFAPTARAAEMFERHREQALARGLGVPGPA